MNIRTTRVVAAVFLATCLSACGGGGGSAATRHSVTLSWTTSHQAGVNSLGGGYQVSISGQPIINVPYVSGAMAPTSTTVSLTTGTYVAVVRAYAVLDASGGTGGSLSAPSQSIVINVP